MKVIKKIFALTLLFAGSVLYGQNYFEPNYALKTPGTLEILNVELKRDATVISASIENLIEGGYFCIDPETYIHDSGGKKLKLSNIIGLPLCPDSYRFKKVGELRYLTLTFPPLPQDTEWFSIIDIHTVKLGNGQVRFKYIVLPCVE